MSKNKTSLFSPKNQDWRTVESKTEKVNGILTNIPTKDITELKDLIYAGEKLASEKERVPLMPWIHLRIDWGGTKKYSPEDKLVDDQGHRLTFERWQRQTIWVKKRK